MKTNLQIILLCLIVGISQSPGRGLSAETQINDEALASPKKQVVQVIQAAIQLRPREPGAFESVSVNLDLENVTASEITITGYDIDAVDEAVMTINGNEIGLPPEIIADMGGSTVTFPLPLTVLKQGNNEIGFLFSKAVGGTSGFAIYDLKVVLHRQ